MEEVYLTRNEVFIAHVRCVHAGGEATMEKDAKKYILKYCGERKYIADVSLYFHYTWDDNHYGSDARKVEFRK